MDKQRQQFEAWWMRDVPHDYTAMTPILMQRDATSKYTNPRCEGAWEVWQAASGAAVQEPVAQTGMERAFSSSAMSRRDELELPGATTYIDRFVDALGLLCRSKPPKAICEQWLNGESEELQSWAVSNARVYWQMGIGTIEAAQHLADNPEEGEGHEGFTSDYAAPVPRQAEAVPSDTGNAEADRLINRLMSADPEFDDCADAAAFIRRLVVEHRGPDGFETWKDAAIDEKMKRVRAEHDLRVTSQELLAALRMETVGELSPQDALRYMACRESAIERGLFATPDEYDAMVDDSLRKKGKEVLTGRGHNYGKKVAKDGSLYRPAASTPATTAGALDERTTWDDTRHSLAVAMSAFATRPEGRRGLDAAVSVLDAITEPGSPLSWLRAASSATPSTSAGEGESAVKSEPAAWRYDTDYGVIYLSMQCDHTYADENGEYVKGIPLYLGQDEK